MWLTSAEHRDAAFLINCNAGEAIVQEANSSQGCGAPWRQSIQGIRLNQRQMGKIWPRNANRPFDKSRHACDFKKGGIEQA
jgi:hypothetical protein